MSVGQTDHPQSIITLAAGFFGIGRLDFRLTKGDRRRLLYASALPALVILCDLILFLLQSFKGIPYTRNPSADFGSGLWWHIHSFTSVIEPALTPLSVGLLLMFSIYPVSRPQGSLAFAIAAAFLALSAGFAILSAFPTTLYDANESFKIEIDWYAVNSRLFAQDFGFLAIGYAFLAYRGLSPKDYGRQVYGQRRRFTPRSSDE
jgi:hypothetical protein